MNHPCDDWNTSPIPGQDIGGRGRKTAKGTPKQDDESGQIISDGKYVSAATSTALMSEDLQKLRLSDHSSDNNNSARRAGGNIDDDDDEHDRIIKGLLYPGLEAESDEFGCDGFFEEDYATAVARSQQQQAAGRTTAPTTTRTTTDNNTTGSSSSSNNPYFYNDFNNSAPSRIERQGGGSGMMSGYERDYYESMGRRYSDLTQEKLGR